MKGTPSAASPAESQALFDLAVRFHQAGRLQEAETHYRRLLAVDPTHADGLHRLGLVYYQAGRPELAADFLARAIAGNPGVAAYHSHLGLILDGLGRSEEAAAAARMAVKLEPERPDFHQNLGVVLFRAGRLAEAADCYRTAVALDPGLADGHQNLGDVLLELGEAADAAASYRRALSLAADLAEAHTGLGAALLDLGAPTEALEHHHRALKLAPALGAAHSNLGSALWRLGRFAEAEAHFRRAIELEPGFFQAHSNLGGVLQASGRLDEAIDSVRRALQLAPARPDLMSNLALILLAQGDPAEAMGAAVRALSAGHTADGRRAFVQCARSLRLEAGAEEVRPWLLRALREHWGRPEDLAGFTVGIVRREPAVARALEQIRATWPEPDQDAEEAALAAAADPLLTALLPLAPNVDFDMERLLTVARRVLLEIALGERRADTEATQPFFAALAQQCFINEYVFRRGDDEAAKATGLKDALGAALEACELVSPWGILAVAAYFPLHTIRGAERLPTGAWDPEITAVVRQQVVEPGEEGRLRASIPRLTKIEAAGSRLVQSQYEENPYPRWVHADWVGAPQSLSDYIRRKFPHAGLADDGGTVGADILVAGCGTGRNAIETARAFSGARILAVDLSLSSLSHALRKSRELEVERIDYAQADLLEMGTLDRRFDLIEAMGVLHHLQDPMKGWRTLLPLLKPGGFMKIGLYSRLARRNLPDMRDWLDGAPAAPDRVREARQILAERDDAEAHSAVAAADFYSVSACRDLLFHLQEHRLTLAEIGAFLCGNGLAFVGFELEPQVLADYRRRFPDDVDAVDLGRWAMFEAERPDTFAGMYQFWVRTV